MTTLDVRASVLRDIAALMNNDSAMRTVQHFLKKLRQEIRAKEKEEKCGIDLAIEDYKAGYVHRAHDTEDLLKQLMS